jgi:hypothetical protein
MKPGLYIIPLFRGVPRAERGAGCVQCPDRLCCGYTPLPVRPFRSDEAGGSPLKWGVLMEPGSYTILTPRGYSGFDVPGGHF